MIETILEKFRAAIAAIFTRSSACTFALLLGFALICAPAIGQEGEWITCVQKSSDTEQVLPRVKEGLSCIPRSIRDALQSDGYKIIVTPTMAYRADNSDFQRRSSYDVGSVNNIAGLFRSREKAVYIPEKGSRGNEPMRLQNSKDVT